MLRNITLLNFFFKKVGYQMTYQRFMRFIVLKNVLPSHGMLTRHLGTNF